MWKSQLAIANNFISSIDNDEEHVLNSKSENIEIINDDTDEDSNTNTNSSFNVNSSILNAL